MSTKSRQVTMADMMSRKVLKDATESIQGIKVKMERRATVDSALLEVHKSRTDSLVSHHMRAYQAAVAKAAPKRQNSGKENTQDDESVGCDEGIKFLTGLEELEGPSFLFSSGAASHLTEIVGNHANHSSSSLSSRAANLLHRIVRKQPPATVEMTPSGGLVLEVQHHSIDPPACITKSQMQPAVPPQPSKRCPAMRGKTTELAASAHFGLRWLSPKLDDLAILLSSIAEDDKEIIGEKITAQYGAILLIQYYLEVWDMDMCARLQVVNSHCADKFKQKMCQKLVHESQMFRALDEGSTLQASLSKTLDILTLCSKLVKQEVEQYSDLVLTIRALAGNFLRQAVRVLGATEDLGMSNSGTSIVALGIKRQHVDSALITWLERNTLAEAWEAALSALDPHDRLRVLFMLLGKNYKKMGYEESKVRKHGSAMLLDVLERFDGDSRREFPATFLDVPPSMTLQLLATTDLLKKFFDSCFKRDTELLSVFVHYLCTSAALCLPSLIAENRFAYDSAAETTTASRSAARLLDNGTGTFLDTFLRFSDVMALNDTVRHELLLSELTACQVAMETVMLFIDTKAMSASARVSQSSQASQESMDELMIDCEQTRSVAASSGVSAKQTMMQLCARMALKSALARVEAS